MELIQGGVTAAKGFAAAGVEAGIKYKNRKDMALVLGEVKKPIGIKQSDIVKIDRKATEEDLKKLLR